MFNLLHCFNPLFPGQLTYIVIYRTRVQQITGATYDPHPRSGSVLPPPADEVFNNNYSSGKPSNKIATIVSFSYINVLISWVALSIT